MTCNPVLALLILFVCLFSLWFNVIQARMLYNKQRLIKLILKASLEERSFLHRKINKENYKRFWQGYAAGKRAK